MLLASVTGRARPGRLLRPIALLLSALTLLGVGLVAGLPAQALAPASSSGSNPLVGNWGVYTGRADPLNQAYQAATGTRRELLGTMANQPRVRWFGAWIPVSQIGDKLREHIENMQAGDPDRLVQLATFNLWPRGEWNKNSPLTTAERRTYVAWVDQAAAAIGSARVALVLEPDLGVSVKGWSPGTRYALTNYAARKFSALPRTSVYLDASDQDWLRPDIAVDMLMRSGIAYARGFALGATHYWSVGAQISYTHTLVSALAKAGAPDKHAVIDTADNGRPFTWLYYYAHHPQGRFDNANVCRTRASTHCITLGAKPTWNTADPANVDAYLWFGRPWLNRQAAPFDMARALGVAATTPYR